MIVLEQGQLGKILGAIADELDIPDSKYQDAKGKYEAVGEWLGRNDSSLFKFQPKIFAQGSIRLGTCVKPLEQDEFDIDLVCKLFIPLSASQSYVYGVVGNRLREHGYYRKILEPQNRCWRLNYAGEFHMDVLPAIPDNARNDKSLLVPDKELKSWKESNPEGYADWFFRQMEVRRMILLKEADVESIPEHQIKTPLQRSVQLLKRHRDIVFKDDLDDKPISIIITTLAAKAYKNEADVFEALVNIVEGMPAQFDIVDGQYAVLNPINKKENFADKWQKHPQRRVKFFQWLAQVKSQLEQTLQFKNTQEVLETFKPTYGEKIVEKAGSKILPTLGTTAIIKGRDVSVPHIEIRNPNKPWSSVG